MPVYWWFGLSGNGMQIENQDKVALISKNRPEWDAGYIRQQISVTLCPIYPTTNINELNLFLMMLLLNMFLSGADILEKSRKHTQQGAQP